MKYDNILNNFEFEGSRAKVKVTVAIFSSPEHEVLMVSYCDQSMSIVRRPSSTICSKS